MSEYPILHGEHYDSCILRRWRPAFLHPKGEIQICHRADEQNALKTVLRGWGQGGEMTQALYAHMNSKTIKKKDYSLPLIKVLTKPVYLRKPANPWPMRKTHLTQS
jgi:hypothetical protein